ncbi:hypothetical protein NIES2109_63850 (plasmid) [Nostoc sp. HK-01]|nr:hypothetical protein NIES2109_60220 [Nostoc sp. HK-01]BBD63510.1 hypothetical protein NIES2109_63850 [Nostoc sp. HK-01]
MINSHQYGSKRQRPILRLKLALYIVLRSVIIGLISGSVLGALFGCAFMIFSIWTAAFGTGLGLGLGLVNGVLLSFITCLFFYPLKYPWLYNLIVKVISAFVAGVGVATFGPWYFSSQYMTPSSAVLIGFSSVLASVIAGFAGWLAGKNISQWYEQKNQRKRRKSTLKATLHDTTPLNTAEQHLEDSLWSKNLGWIYLGLLSFLCSFLGQMLLQFIVCGNQDVRSCLPSPRLYTSVIAGFKVVIPAILVIILIFNLVKIIYKKHNSKLTS